MEQIRTNMEKYDNYQLQMTRLKKALKEGFWLEAIFIEYAVMEDRLESVLRHGGKWKPDAKRIPSITQKINLVSTMARQAPAKKYFSPELLEEILVWKNQRNPLIHALLRQKMAESELEAIAQQGNLLATQLCSKATSYRRAMEREAGRPS